MDKRYDGHDWMKTQTPNISNDLGLVFLSSTCVGHLECYNPHCDYLQRAHCNSPVNNIDFDGFTKEPFPVGGPLPLGSTLMCRVCTDPPTCIASCHAKSSTSMTMTPPNVRAFIWATIGESYSMSVER